MTLETDVMQSESGTANGTHARKRNVSGEPQGVQAQKQQQQQQQQQQSASDAKRSKATVANDGWGELFKNRENFLEMHLC